MRLDALRLFLDRRPSGRFRDIPAEPDVCQTIALEPVYSNFYNTEQSYTAYCPDGYEGTPVTVTKAAGSFSSVLGVATANALALAAAQSEAEAALSCTEILQDIDSFPAQPDDDVYDAFQQTDGKILICGIFQNIGVTAQAWLARINTNGTVDTSFAPTVDAAVFKIRQLSDGKIVIVGNFATVNGFSQDNISVLNSDGTRDTAFGAACTPTPDYVAEEPDGNLLFSRHRVSGAFTTINGSGWTNSIARISRMGVHDTTFGAGITYPDNGGIGISVGPSGEIYVHRLGSSTSNWSGYKGMVKVNATTGAIDAGFDAGLTGVSGFVAVTQVQESIDGNIWINGHFTRVNTTEVVDCVAKINPSTGIRADSLSLTITPSTSSRHVNRLAERSDGYLVLAGFFATVNGSTRVNIAAVNSTTGVLHSAWPNLAPSVEIANADRGDLIVLSPYDYVLIGEQDSFTIAGSSRDAISIIDRDGALVSLT